MKEQDLTAEDLQALLDKKGVQKISYKDAASGDPRVGYYDPHTGIFIATTTDRKVATVETGITPQDLKRMKAR